MANKWSINPNTLASIDDNGKATFQEHTQDTNYTITYNDGTSGNITKTFTVYACSQPPVDCSVYEFSTITTPLETHATTSIAYSLRSLEQLTYTIMSSGGFLTGITIVHTSDRWQYMGEFNTTTSTSDRTATIEYKNGDGTCVFTQQLVMKGETDCSVYEFSTITTPLETHATTSIAYSLRSLEQLTYTIKNNGGFLTGITVVGTSDRWQYMGEFNTTTSPSDRTATIEYKNGDGTCVFTQQLVMKGETDCSVYEFSTITTPLETHATTSIAYSLRSLEQLTYTIKNNGGFLTGITVVGTSDRWQYMGEFNTTTSPSDRTATIEYKNGDETCVFTQQLVMKGETDCSVYNWTQYTSTLEPSTTSYTLATSSSQQQQLNVQVVDSGGFVQRIYSTQFSSDKHGYIGEYLQNTTTSSKQATIKYTSQDGYCEWTQVVTQKGVFDCSVYEFSTRTTPLETHATTPIAWSIDSLEQLTYTIKNNGGFLTGITIVHTSDRWQYMGEFNTTTSTSDRTATIEYKNSDGTCVFTQQLVMKGETDCPQYNITPDVQVTCDGGIVHFTATTD